MAVHIVQRAKDKGRIGCSEGDKRCESYAGKPKVVEARDDAGPEEQREDGRRVIQRHLFIHERRNEERTAPQEAAGEDAGYAGKHEAEHNGVVLEVRMVDQDGCGLHQKS